MFAPNGQNNSHTFRTKCPKRKEDLSSLMTQSPKKVKDLCSLLQEAPDFQSQINCLQKWKSDLESVASLFFLLPLKSSLRRSIASKIKNYADSEEILTSYFLKELKKYDGSAFISNVIKCCDDNNAILRQLPTFLSIEPFMKNITQTLSANNESELSEVLRALSYARVNAQNSIFETHPDLKILLHKIVQRQCFSTDTRGKSAKILLSEEILCQPGYDVLLDIISLIKNTSSPYFCTNIECELIYYYGIVTSSSFLCIIKRVLLEYKKISRLNDLCPTSVVTLSRGFLRCSNVLLPKAQELNDKDICCIEQFICDYLDHPMDSVKYNVKNVLKDYIKMKYQMGSLEDLALKVLKWDKQDKRRYVVLTPVIKFGGFKIIWFILKKSASFKEMVIENLSDSILRSSCTELYKTCLNHVEDCEKWTWLKPVIDGYKNDTGNLCRRNHLDLLVKEIIKRGGPSIADALINDILNEDNRSPTSTCIALQSLKTIKLLKGSEFHFEDSSFIIECMTDLSDEVRLEAFDFIVSSLKTSEVLEKVELNLILEYGVKTNMLLSDPPLQMQFLSTIKKFLCRLNESFVASKRVNDENTCKLYIESLKKLNDWIVMENLSKPLIHLYFRTLGYEILLMCCEIFGKENKLYSLNSEHGIVLVDCLKNESHDKNCDNIIKILHKYYEGNRSIVRFSTETIIKLLRTPMPRNATIAQYLTNVLRICKYDEEFENVLFEEFVSQVNRAKSSLVNASFEGPIYGVLGCLKGGPLIKSLVEYCYEIWNLVSPVVNDSSPEGFSQESNNSLECDPQLLLLLAWRTTKEVCDLFQIVATRNDVNTDILKISKFFIQVFSETKHRGVFERAYTGFCAICNLLWLHDDLKIRQFPRKLLDETLQTISLVRDDVTVTRRSAGFPFLIQALISSEPGMSSFDHVMKQLLGWSSLSSSNISLKVHAYNILRAIYKDSLLGDQVMKYISCGIKTAILGFKSSFWPIRNSSTLLFSSLITRLFGVKRDQDDLSEKNGSYTYKIFFERFPELYNFFLEQLDTSKDKTSPPSLNCTTIFPTLLILAKLKTTPCLVSSKITVELHHFHNQIIGFLSHPVLKIRHLASYALCALSSEESELRLAKALIDHMTTSCSSSNALHGILYSLNLMIKKNPKIKQVIMSYFQDQASAIPIRSPMILTERLNLLGLSEPNKVDLMQELSQIKGSDFPHPGKHLYYSLLLEKSVEWTLLSRNENMAHFLMAHNTPMYFEILLTKYTQVESFALCLNEENKEKRVELCSDLNEFQCFLRLFLNTDELDCPSSIWNKMIHLLESPSIMSPINFEFLQLCVNAFTKLIKSFNTTHEELRMWGSIMKKWVLLDGSIVLKRNISISISESINHLKSINESNSTLVALLLWFVLLILSCEDDYFIQKIIYKILIELWGTKKLIVPNQMYMELCDWLLTNSSVYVSETKYVLYQAFEAMKEIGQNEKTNDDELSSLAFEKGNEHIRYDVIYKVQEKIRSHYGDNQLKNEEFQLQMFADFFHLP
ncbi:tRNA (32-2'-O)-methyltransferase regulator THADA [Lepeophtheirus salmonis]|uniref:tRNA (32-2'-O)-methyltransferase regulator THADA n=1 Tax=Lepeophtheirus salmonis TaxID=72036 RepID=UPI001AE0FB9E|nr:thyroid adenoma-associated protein homolog [Lepeophtheirus salmonis]